MVEKLTELLPEYEKPPVVEVAVMVQFEAPTLGLAEIVRWWCQIQERFPGFEQAPPIPPATESFDISKPAQPSVHFQLSGAPPIPRLFIKKATDTELIQIQSDRFGYSWRKLKPDDDYPRYVNLRNHFLEQLDTFEKFLTSEHLEAMKPTLCEVTYVNHILGSGVWGGHNELHKVIPTVTPTLSDDFLPLPESMQFAAKYVINADNNRPLGRLYVNSEPRFFADRIPFFLMRLTVRGAPQGLGSEGILKTFDLGHEWIVRAFTTLTAPEMHKAWRRIR